MENVFSSFEKICFFLKIEKKMMNHNHNNGNVIMQSPQFQQQQRQQSQQQQQSSLHNLQPTDQGVSCKLRWKI